MTIEAIRGCPLILSGLYLPTLSVWTLIDSRTWLFFFFLAAKSFSQWKSHRNPIGKINNWGRKCSPSLWGSLRDTQTTSWTCRLQLETHSARCHKDKQTTAPSLWELTVNYGKCSVLPTQPAVTQGDSCFNNSKVDSEKQRSMTDETVGTGFLWNHNPASSSLSGTFSKWAILSKS